MTRDQAGCDCGREHWNDALEYEAAIQVNLTGLLAEAQGLDVKAAMVARRDYWQLAFGLCGRGIGQQSFHLTHTPVATYLNAVWEHDRTTYPTLAQALAYDRYVEQGIRVGWFDPPEDQAAWPKLDELRSRSYDWSLAAEKQRHRRRTTTKRQRRADASKTRLERDREYERKRAEGDGTV